MRERLENILAILAAHPIPEECPEGGWGTWIIELGISEASLSADEDFHEILHQVDGLVDETLGLDRYIGQIAPFAKDLAQSSSTGVRIMSMASSKGLTAEATILPGLEAGVMPRPDQDRGGRAASALCGDDSRQTLSLRHLGHAPHWPHREGWTGSSSGQTKPVSVS